MRGWMQVYHIYTRLAYYRPLSFLALQHTARSQRENNSSKTVKNSLRRRNRYLQRELAPMCACLRTSLFNVVFLGCASVADPNPDPDASDPYVFWASWIRIHKSDVWIWIRIRIRIRIRIFLSSSKNSKKNLVSYCFGTSL
jgi:hypothetical protein